MKRAAIHKQNGRLHEKKHKPKNQSLKNILNFISEAGLLKRVKRSGWSILGIDNPESVADHSFRCAVIGYVLACMEKIPAYNVLLMTLFNDIQEARITDLHKMAQYYIDADSVENNAFCEQVSNLPKDLNQELLNMCSEYKRQNTKQSIVARDADILECLIQAKEYYQYGFLEAKKFMQKAPRHLSTKSAKKLWKLAKASDTNNWWFRLSKFKR